MAAVTVTKHASGDAMAAAAADLLAAAVRGVGDARRCCVALAGGSTPKKLYALLDGQNFHGAVAPVPPKYFFGDVRMVPDDHADSNFKMAHDAWLKNVPPGDVFKVDTAAAPEAAAAAYGEVLARECTAPREAAMGGLPAPVLDVVLLGVGPDGHTLSLFPGTPAPAAAAICTPCMPPAAVSPHVARVSVTAAVVYEARHVIVMVTGAEKAEAVKGILAPGNLGAVYGEVAATAKAAYAKQLPAGAVPVARLVRGCRGKVTLMLDDAVAAAAGVQ